ncbi:MAG: RhuM family protein [Bacteroidia bacterium]
MDQDNQLQKFPNFVIFKTATGKVNIDVFFQNDTLWLTQKKMAELFEKGRSTITEHLKNIFKEGELDENSVCRDFRHTAEDGKTYQTKYYNLRAITAVGYRVNSHRATEFRKWATEILHEYIIKGFAMDKYRVVQDRNYISDFDKEIKRITGKDNEQ